MKKSKVLITGGAGFQGSHLVADLIKKGHEVTILNTPSPEATKNIRLITQEVDLPQIVWGSVTDPEIVYKTMRNKDLVLHLAARINIDESLVDIKPFLDVNIYGTYNVLEVAKKLGTKVIYTSSCEIYGQSGNPFQETIKINPKNILEEINLNPHSPYAATKCAADRLCYAYFKSFGLPVVIVRPFNLFGERQKENGYGAVVPIFVRRALEKKPLLIHGDGKQTRDYLYISDLIRAYEIVLDNMDKFWGQAINIASGKKTSILKIANYISRHFKVPIKHIKDRPGQVREYTSDISKIKRLGFKPKISLEKGLGRYIKWRTFLSYKLQPSDQLDGQIL